MKQHVVLVADNNSFRQKRMTLALSTVNLAATTATTFDRLKQELIERRYEALLVHENVTKQRLKNFCCDVHKGDPALVIVARLAKAKSSLEIKLFDVGVDDIVTDPMAANTIAKRIIIRLQRRRFDNQRSRLTHFGNVTVDFENFEVWNQGKISRISKGQSSLLKFFLTNRKQVIPRSKVFELFWHNSIIDPEGKNLDMHVSKLRQLIEPDPANPTFLQTVHGVGYKLSF